MSTSTELNAVIMLEKWFSQNKGEFQLHCSLVELKNINNESIQIKLENKRYLIDICGWNHELCLNIEILEIKTEINTFMYSGHCNSTDAFQTQLANFINWFNNENNII